jgi:hypothetical protein
MFWCAVTRGNTEGVTALPPLKENLDPRIPVPSVGKEARK